MFNSKIYTEKLPKNIREPLKQFARNDCLLVKKCIQDVGLENRQGNCHINVKGYVDALGGEMVNGWLLNRDKRFINQGIWCWSFHSVWLTHENLLVDVTDDKNYQTNAFTTFTPDTNRKFNLEEGINFNNIVIFDNEALAKNWGNYIGKDLKVGVIYWASADMLRLKDLTEHTGQYRLLHKGYTHNHTMLYEKYGIAIVDNKVIQLDAANDKVHADVLFDFSLSCAA
jgi:hypothetical protein